MAAGLAALAALGAPSGRKGVGGRFAAATAAGVCVGAYIALEFFPGQPPLQVHLQCGGHSKHEDGIPPKIEACSLCQMFLAAVVCGW